MAIKPMARGQIWRRLGRHRVAWLKTRRGGTAAWRARSGAETYHATTARRRMALAGMQRDGAWTEAA